MPATLIALGVAVLVATLVWIGHDRPRVTAFGESPATPGTIRVTGPRQESTSASDPVTEPALPLALSALPTVASPTLAPAAAASGPPVLLTIPALGVNAPVDEVLSDGAVLHPPDDPSRVGWWIGSSPIGASTGSTVLVGHVDSAAQGEGALFELTQLDQGSLITSQTADGAAAQFTVTARAVYPKTTDLPADLFRATGPPQLVLITCGGDFDANTGSYTDNVVVTATPAG